MVLRHVERVIGGREIRLPGHASRRCRGHGRTTRCCDALRREPRSVHSVRAGYFRGDLYISVSTLLWWGRGNVIGVVLFFGLL